MSSIYGEAVYGQDTYGAEPEQPRNTRMGNLSRDIKKLAYAQKIIELKKFVQKCQESTVIGDVAALIAPVSSAITKFETDVENTGKAKSAWSNMAAVQQVSENDLDTKTEKLMATIDLNTDGDPVKLGTTGLAVVTKGGKPANPPPAQVVNLNVSGGDNPGEQDLQWDPQSNPKPRLYKARYCVGAYDPTKMVDGGTATASKMTIPGLQSGAEHWFEVCAVGTGGQQGPWSDPAKGRPT